MKQALTASITREGTWFIAQCLEVDIASQGETAEAALANLGEALALHFAPPMASTLPQLRPIEVEIGAAEAAALSGSQTEVGGGRVQGGVPAGQPRYVWQTDRARRSHGRAPRAP